jgi:hypothetical protein
VIKSFLANAYWFFCMNTSPRRTLIHWGALSRKKDELPAQIVSSHLSHK